jgi:hypothetical protein
VETRLPFKAKTQKHRNQTTVLKYNLGIKGNPLHVHFSGHIPGSICKEKEGKSRRPQQPRAIAGRGSLRSVCTVSEDDGHSQLGERMPVPLLLKEQQTQKRAPERV